MVRARRHTPIHTKTTTRIIIMMIILIVMTMTMMLMVIMIILLLLIIVIIIIERTRSFHPSSMDERKGESKMLAYWSTCSIWPHHFKICYTSVVFKQAEGAGMLVFALIFLIYVQNPHPWTKTLRQLWVTRTSCATSTYIGLNWSNSTFWGSYTPVLCYTIALIVSFK